MSEIFTPIDEMKQNAMTYLRCANGYYKVLTGTLNHRSRFDNDVLYGIVAMSFEKFMIALLSTYHQFATNHVPIFLFREARLVEDRLTDEMRETSKLIGQFESICSLDGFGYHTPSDIEIRTMIIGLSSISEFVNKRVYEEI